MSSTVIPLLTDFSIKSLSSLRFVDSKSSALHIDRVLPAQSFDGTYLRQNFRLVGRNEHVILDPNAADIVKFS